MVGVAGVRCPSNLAGGSRMAYVRRGSAHSESRVGSRPVAELNWTISGAETLAARAAEWNELIATARYPPFLRTQFLLPALAPGGKWEPTLASLGRALPGMVLSVRVTQQDPRLAAHADSAIILKTTYDESLKGLSPGQLL